MLETIIKNPTSPATACIIWLHGLGADGHDFVPIIPQLKLPENLAVKFIFPHAPMRPVTLNAGMTMRAWFDITSLDFDNALNKSEIQQSQKSVDELIAEEINAGIPANKIILAGFSQGGAIALYTGLCYQKELAGIIALSSFLPFANEISPTNYPTNKNTPIFIGHGSQDPLVPEVLGKASYLQLKDIGYNASWHSYPMEHSVCDAEIADTSQWLQQVLR